MIPLVQIKVPLFTSKQSNLMIKKKKQKRSQIDGVYAYMPVCLFNIQSLGCVQLFVTLWTAKC